MTSNEESFTFSQTQIALPPRDRTHYVIPRRDWQRLRRDLDACDVSGSSFYASAGWTGIGVAAGGGIGLVSLYATETSTASLPAWAKVVLWVVVVAGFLVAVGMLLMGKDKASANRTTVNRIASEMKDMENEFHQVQEAQAQP